MRNLRSEFVAKISLASLAELYCQDIRAQQFPVDFLFVHYQSVA